MKTKIQILAAVFALVSAGTAMAAGGGETEDKGTMGIVKELTIMSKVLDKRLSDQLGQDVYASNMFQRGVEAFYVLGVGAIFFVDVKFPVAEPPQVERAPKGEPDDLWKQYEREFEGESSQKPSVDWPTPAPGTGVIGGAYGFGGYGGGFPGQRKEFSKSKVDDLKDTIFEVFSRYGGRISVANRDQIIVVVNGAGGGLRSFIHMTPYGTGMGGGGMNVGVGASGSVSMAADPSGKVSAMGSTGETAGGAAGVTVNAPVAVAATEAEAPASAEPTDAAAAAVAERTGEATTVESGPGDVVRVTQFKGPKSAQRIETQIVRRSSGSTLPNVNITTIGPGAPAYRSVLVIRIPVKDLVDDAAKLAGEADVSAYSY